MKVELKGAGFTRRRLIDVESPVEVSSLQKSVKEELGLKDETSLKLVIRGKAVPPSGFVEFQPGDSVFVVVAPKAPPSYVRTEEEEDDDLRLKLPENASHLHRKLVQFLRNKLRIPDILLLMIFSVGLKRWLIILSWLPLAYFANKLDQLLIFLLVTIFLLIFFNLGKREAGELSAYSIFNENFEEIPGTFNAERIDRDLRAGRMF